MKILLIDDEAGALKLLKRAVERSAPESNVEAFQDPREAVDFAKSYRPDVAFLDIQMPDLNGLEVARMLKGINANVNVIFVTGYSDYAVDAMSLRSSGYLMKPVTKEDVETELANLRHPVTSAIPQGLFAKTFGNFDLFKDGTPIVFRREKSKEVLAYLIDREGSSATRKEIAASVFGDSDYSRSTQAYLTQIIKSLRSTLHEASASEILVIGHNTYAVNIDAFTCDAYDFQAGLPDAINSFHGAYLSQYAWADYSIGKFSL